MMEVQLRPGSATRSWKAYDGADGELLDAQLKAATRARCPCCGGELETQPTTRLRSMLPRTVRGFDLECRACLRFHPCLQHTDRAPDRMRLRRFATAVLRA